MLLDMKDRKTIEDNFRMNQEQNVGATNEANLLTSRQRWPLQLTTMLMNISVGYRLLLIIFVDVSGLGLADSRCYRIPDDAYASTPQGVASPPVGTRFNVTCENLGTLTQVPDILSSFNGTYELVIRNGTTIFLIQATAFASCAPRRLVLVGLWVTLVDQRAFNGLESTLEFLDLGSNDISRLHPDTFVSLAKLAVLVLDDNWIYVIPDGLLATPRSLDSVDLRRNRISSLSSSSGLFQRQGYLQSLLLGGNVITALGNRTFKGLDFLRTLDLSDNGFTDLDYSAFRDVGHLMSLNLRKNRLTGISRSFCQYLQYLVDLDISSNEITNLSDDVFSGCPALKQLNLSDNSLTALPNRSIEILQELNTLDVSGNNLSTFRWAQLQNLQLLARLNLSRNSLSSLPSAAFFYNDDLRTVNLSSNRLSYLAYGLFSSSNSIETLDLSQNELTFTDVISLQALVRAKYLNLSGNRLEGVVPQPAFQSLASLEHLDLSLNQISQVVKDSFAPLPQLKWLNLDHNRIFTIADDAFVGNLILSSLSLTDNPLQDLTRLRSNSLRVLYAGRDNLTDLPLAGTLAYLEELHFRNNQISIIPLKTSAFRLKLLDLTHNTLEVLDLNGVLSSLPFLERLILRGNSIREIQPGTVMGVSNLVELDLSENCLARLKQESVLAVSQSLLRLSVDRNPFLCSCDLLWMRNYAPLINRNDTLCFFANGTSNSWTGSTCNSKKNCSDASEAKDDSVYDPACSRPSLTSGTFPYSTFPACFRPSDSSSSGRSSTRTPFTPFAAASKSSDTTPTYVYILIPLLGCALTATAAAVLLARWHRRRSKIPIQNGHPALRTFPRLSVPFESFKIPNGNGIGRPTNFQLSTLHVRNAMGVRRFGQRYLDGVRGISR